MLEQLIQMATSQLGNQLQNNPELANQNIDIANVAQTAGSSIFETIANQISGGNTNALQEMVSGNETDSNNPAVSSMTTNIVESLVEKSGVSPQVASTIAAIAIPMVMNMFNKQAGAAQSNGIDIGGLISGALSGGGQQSGGGGLLGGLLGSVLGGGNQQSGGSIGTQVLGSVLSKLLK